MTAEPPGNPVTDGVRSLEVRWIFPGQLDTAVTRWFAHFPARMESREDSYLLNPQLRGLSVKIRGGGALEVKVYRGSAGNLEVPGRARGRMEAWQKWSFPFSPLRQDGGDPADWQPVRMARPRRWWAGRGDGRGGCLPAQTIHRAESSLVDNRVDHQPRWPCPRPWW
jgi:hypothetical protein